MTQTLERRRFERFALAPMYTTVAVRTADSDRFRLEGHAYDVSEGGVQFELDEPLQPGTPISLQITLPRPPGEPWDGLGPGRAMFVTGTVVWCDESEPGPVRHAVAFGRFARPVDRDRLLSHISRRALRRAA